MVKTELSHGTWGLWPTIRLATEAVEVVVAGEIGARVISLKDRRRGREWLVQGEPPAELEQMAWAEEGAPFGPRESFGWDECLPTTLPSPDPLDAAAPQLRDHGDQWGRGAYLSTDAQAGALVHTWHVPRWPYRMSRRLSFEDEQTLLAEYVLLSLADQPLPITWAQHALFELENGAVIDLPEVERVRPSASIGIELPDELDWPVATLPDGRTLNLSCIARESAWATVVYAEPGEDVRAVQPDGARLDLDWDRRFAPILRVWLSNSGWSDGGPPNIQFGLEPVTSADDDLGAALERDRARTLAPGGELRWWVRLRLS
jgi:galactose mutarotase-like enzyme